MISKQIISIVTVGCTLFATATLSAAPLAINFYRGSGSALAAGKTIDGIDTWIDRYAGEAQKNRVFETLADGAQFWYTNTTYWNPGINDTLVPLYWSTLDSFYNTNYASNRVIDGYTSLLQFGNLSEWMSENNYTGYEIIVYSVAYGSSDLGAFEVYGGDFTAATVAGDFTNLLGTITPVMTPATSYTYTSSYSREVLSGLTADSVLIAAPKRSGTGGGIAAIALVGIPEPSTYALIGGGLALGLVVLRRRQ